MISKVVVYKIENIRVKQASPSDQCASESEVMSNGSKNFVFTSPEYPGSNQEIQCREISSKFYTNQMLQSLPFLKSCKLLKKQPKGILESPKTKDKSPKPSKRDTSGRTDIHNRRILRMIKKLYTYLFLYHNDKLRNKRFINIPLAVTLAELKKFAAVYIPGACFGDMAEFLFQFFNFNSSDSKPNSVAAQTGADAFNCTHTYTVAKFEALMSSELFRMMIISFMKLRNATPDSVISMRDSQKWEKQYEVSPAKFDDILTNCLYSNLGPKVGRTLEKVYAKCVSFRVGHIA
ncbi:unnamed protein product [Moneuplotes crassus]|uniref:Uncharacterized protein n=1 Tax=Euplotes crassus TaxID=5936 RepID=A0AAD1UFR4_EUPCR|nr:unnamed protein product [Moneuplotes crassus]